MTYFLIGTIFVNIIIVRDGTKRCRMAGPTTDGAGLIIVLAFVTSQSTAARPPAARCGHKAGWGLLRNPGIGGWAALPEA